jgi:hypothetical protein
MDPESGANPHLETIKQASTSALNCARYVYVTVKL